MCKVSRVFPNEEKVVKFPNLRIFLRSCEFLWKHVKQITYMCQLTNLGFFPLLSILNLQYLIDRFIHYHQSRQNLEQAVNWLFLAE